MIMPTNSWLCLDELRESWVFLLLGVQKNVDSSGSATPQNDAQLDYWEIGVGNTESLVETNAERIESEHVGSEADLIESLLTELEPYRYQDSVLITPDHQTARKLRRRIVAATSKKTPSLRGFEQVILEEQLTQYFGQELYDYKFDQPSRSPPRRTETDPEQVVSSGSAREFWELWRKVFRLLPPAELAGEKV